MCARGNSEERHLIQLEKVFLEEVMCRLNPEG